jgi:hypothetical protein
METCLNLTFFRSLYYSRFISASSGQQRVAAGRTRTKLVPSFAFLAELARSTRDTNGSVARLDEHCRTLCSAIILSKHGPTNVNRGGRGPSCRLGGQGRLFSGAFDGRGHGAGIQIHSATFQVSVSISGRTSSWLGSISAVVILADSVAGSRGSLGRQPLFNYSEYQHVVGKEGQGKEMDHATGATLSDHTASIGTLCADSWDNGWHQLYFPSAAAGRSAQQCPE